MSYSNASGQTDKVAKPYKIQEMRLPPFGILLQFRQTNNAPFALKGSKTHADLSIADIKRKDCMLRVYLLITLSNMIPWLGTS